MKTKLPTININQRYIKLNIKPKIYTDETKSNKINLFHNNKRINKGISNIKGRFHISNYVNII